MKRGKRRGGPSTSRAAASRAAKSESQPIDGPHEPVDLQDLIGILKPKRRGVTVEAMKVAIAKAASRP